MNCITTFVVHYYNLQPGAWTILLEIIDTQAESFPYQGGVMVRKILSEKMNGLSHCPESISDICVKLIKSKNNEDSKACVESIHNLKTILQLMVENYSNRNFSS